MNQTFLWGLATSLQKLDMPREALGAYRDLLRSILADKENNHYNEIVCLLDMSKISLNMADSTAARLQLSSILRLRGTSFPISLQSRAQMKFEEAERLLRTLSGQKTSTE